MSAPVRILHLHSSFAYGGKEARAIRLMHAFGRNATHTIVSGVPERVEAQAAIGRHIDWQIAQNPPPLTGKPSVARYEAIANFLRRFDLVLTYNWGAIDGVMARRVFTRGLPPVIHHEDGFNEDEAVRLNPVRNMYRRVALSAAHALVVPSDKLMAVARGPWKQPEARLHLIGNGVPVDRFAQGVAADAIPGFRRKTGEVVIGAVAGLRDVKDLPLLVRAVGGIAVKVRLVIVGEGPERQAILDAAEAMGIDDRVHLPGFLPDAWRYMGLFDIFALSSKSEQQPISVMEAMAAGLPVVAPPVGDIKSMVAEENAPYMGIDRHEVHLRDRLQALATDAVARRKVGEANQAKARAAFDEAVMIARYKALYEDAIGRPGALG
ncbi:glycosyl transferase family 1 [Sphingomonas sp. Leaf407]|uniref:glycosyltransferase n=1 Tax=unclassified Sphingomonas TaxID=196159 RepID=UPI0006F2421A|nr:MULTISPECIES: glycosyltransferase [unclassified Sphingomonas]KQN37766.1 glycosyl transferase family 1 [Sphingomonas sp. Leaf42]KQT28133.1 glycosyl transferase family 1 [Sphingomonas sp. Leaf407]